jgi:hypothetical protein
MAKLPENNVAALKTLWIQTKWAHFGEGCQVAILF